MISSEHLAKKHTGMKICLDGALNHKGKTMGTYIIKELQKHLHMMANGFYEGNIKIVDEFCQLYCLDNKRPEQPAIEQSEKKGEAQ